MRALSFLLLLAACKATAPAPAPDLDTPSGLVEVEIVARGLE